MNPKTNYYTAGMDILFDAVQKALGLNDKQANEIIRYVSQDGESQSFNDFLPKQSRCYIRLGTVMLNGAGTRDRAYSMLTNDTLQKKVEIIDGLSMMLIFYGKDAINMAYKAYAGLYEDEIRSMLLTAGIAPVQGRSIPVWLPELINGKWVDRCDLEIQMYRTTEYMSEVNMIREMPEINMKKE